MNFVENKVYRKKETQREKEFCKRKKRERVREIKRERKRRERLKRELSRFCIFIKRKF